MIILEVEVKKVYKHDMYNDRKHTLAQNMYSYATFYLNLILNAYTGTPDIVYNIDALSNSFFR